MSIPGQMNLLASAAPGDLQIPASNFAQTPNVTSSGAFTYSIPIQVPPGTHGMVPHLALTYSSAGGDGIVGIGWSLSGLSAITRCPQTVAQDGQAVGVGYNTNDRFCLDGQRLLVTNGKAYGADGSAYQTQVSNFAQITASGQVSTNQPEYFTVVMKNGMQYEYGNTQVVSSSQIPADGSNGTIVRVWALDKISDTSGNYMTFSYTVYQSGIDYVPSEIDYTGNSVAGATTYNAVKFFYKSRSDVVTGYQAGYPIRPQELLEYIRTYTGTSQTERLQYTLGYNPVDTANWLSSPWSVWHNELASVQVQDMVNKSELATTSFGWQGQTNNWSMSATVNNLPGANVLEAADFTGDGLTDALIYTSSTCQDGGQIWVGSEDGTTFSGSGTVPSSANYDYWDTSGNEHTYNQSPACFNDLLTNTPPWPLDINGDGNADIMLTGVEYKCPYTCFAYGVIEPLVNQSENFTLNSAFMQWMSAYPAQVGGNLNGDGLGDFFADVIKSDGTAEGYAYYGNGDGTFALDSGHTEFTAYDTLYGGDFLGNGCTDVLTQDSNSRTGEILGFCANPKPTPWTQITGIPYWGTDQIIIADFNGDAKDDILIIPATGNGALYLSTGAGLVKQAAKIPAAWDSYHVVAGDFNSDGKADIALISQNPSDEHAIYLSTGIFSSSAESGFVGPYNPIGVRFGASGDSAVAADWNSDGATDLWIQVPPGIGESDDEVLTSYQPELLTSIQNGLGAKTTISYERINAGGAFYAKGSGDGYPDQDVDGPIYATSAVSVSGAGLNRSWSYAYAGLVRNVDGLGMLGFNSISVTDNNTNILTTTGYYNGYPLNGLPNVVTVKTNSGQGSYVTLRDTTYTWKDNPTDGSCPNASGVGDVVCLEGVTTTGTDLNGTSSWPSVTTSYAYDDLGSEIGKTVTYSDSTNGTELTSVTANSYTLVGSVDFLSTSSVTNTLGGGKPLQRSYQFKPTGIGQIQEAEDEPGTNVELDVTYGYDGWGNANSVTYFDPNSATDNNATPTRQWQYNYTDTSQTDIQGQFPYQIITPKDNYAVYADYAPGSGGMTNFTDMNGNATNAIYDNFGRIESLTRPDNTEAAVGYYFCTDTSAPYYPCVANAAYEVVTTPEKGGAQNGRVTVSYYDDLNRLTTMLTQGMQQPGAFCWSEVDYGYDSLGYLNLVTQPYYNGSPANCTKDPTVRETAYQNDILGRVQSATYSPSNRTDQFTYNALQTSVEVDVYGLKQTTTTTRDDMGWVSQVTDASAGNTFYGYDAFGNAVSVTTPGGAEVQNQFDIRGRKTQTQDPDMGPNGSWWYYTFDAFNELTVQQSPNETAPSQTTLAYDVLGRLTSRTEPDMQSSWQYDTAANGIGLVASEQCSFGFQPGDSDACAGGTYTRSYAYDSLSRPSSVSVVYANGSTCTSANPCKSSETYDPTTKQLGTVTTFSGLTITYGYDPVYGYLSSISENGSSVWQVSSLDASLRIQNETMTSGSATVATIQRSFDPDTGNIGTIYASGNEPGNLANDSYSWDAVGNLLSRTDSLNGYSEFFCYDGLNRLTNSDVVQQGSGNCYSGGQVLKSMGYDQDTVGDGNITGKSDIGIYHYNGDGTNGAGPHAVTSIDTTAGAQGGCTLSRCLVDGISNPQFYYDNDGNLQCVTSKSSCDSTAARSYAWTSFDMAETIASGANATAIAYAPDHQRASLSNSSGTIYYLDNPAGADSEELVAGATPLWRTYLYAYGHIAAEFFTTAGTTTPYYFVGDHLASTAALGDASGNEAELDSYDAWGLGRNPNGSDYGTGCLTLHPPSKTLRRFTGEEAMDFYCLVNLNARMYDPTLGRMLSADPTVPDAMNGQAFNRYSYVVNNPLSLVDPSGYASSCGDTDMSGCGHLPLCNANCAWGAGGACLDCDQPAYRDGDAIAFFLPMGGLEGLGSTGGGFGGGGAATGIGSTDSAGIQLAANQLPGVESDIPTVFVYGCCTGDFLNGDFSWDDSWANAGFLQWNGMSIDDRPLGNGGEGTLFNIGLAIATFGASIAEQLTVKGAAEAASIVTPYAVEVQSASAEAQIALQAAQNGATLYRTGQMGVSMAGESQYWSLENPLTTDYVAQMGLPDVSPDFVMSGTLNPGASVITNEAPGLGANAGGGIQIVTSPGGVGSMSIYMPPF